MRSATMQIQCTSFQVVDYSISSIVEKKRLKDEKLEKDHPELYRKTDFKLLLQ